MGFLMLNNNHFNAGHALFFFSKKKRMDDHKKKRKIQAQKYGLGLMMGHAQFKLLFFLKIFNRI